MNPELTLLFSNLTSIACVIAAALLASKRTGNWGWFLLISVITCVFPKEI